MEANYQTTKPQTVFLPLDQWVWDISNTLWKGSFINYSHFRQHTFHMFLFSCINISAPRPFSLPLLFSATSRWTFCLHKSHSDIKNPWDGLSQYLQYLGKCLFLPNYESPDYFLRVKWYSEGLQKLHKLSIAKAVHSKGEVILPLFITSRRINLIIHHLGR